MTLVAVVSLAALALAAVSLTRLSRMPPAPPAAPEERTYATVRAGDVVVLPGADYLVDGRSEVGEGPTRATLLTLRDGRERRWLLARAEGQVVLLETAPADAAQPGGRQLDRKAVWLLPGAAGA